VRVRLGVTQSQVARIEKRGYDAYTLTTLRRYVAALGCEFSLEVTVRHGASVKDRGEAPVAARA
jgi:transcriptional regulator with XRE-family HTH domain